MFQSTFNELMQSWLLQLQQAEAGETEWPARLETCIRICEESLFELRERVAAHSFPDKDCEICFFKQVKPVIMARYIYYRKIYQLHLGYFKGSGLLEKERLEKELRDLARYFADNEVFYTYYRKGYTHHDDLFFVRGQYDWKICPEVNHFDGVFSTSFDGKLAEMMANELLMKYVDGMLNPAVKMIETAPAFTSPPAVVSSLQCTATLTDIVELGYALQKSTFFNNGNASIKDVMAFMANVLKVDLRNFYHLLFRLRERKNPAKFLDQLKSALLMHIEAMDD